MLTASFLARIGLQGQTITMQSLPLVLREMAKKIPFENVGIIDKTTSPVTREAIIAQIVTNKRGGVCYEINTLLYEVLLENGFDAILVAATIYDDRSNTWSPTGNTHTVIYVRKNGIAYLVDSGFGNNIPLIPVPFSEKIVETQNGFYQIREQDLWMKRHGRDADWRIAYRFDFEALNYNDLQYIQHIIETSDVSPFNKKMLQTIRTEDSILVLSENDFIISQKDKKETWQLTDMEKKAVQKKYFNA